jgi:hypothetical protein
MESPGLNIAWNSKLEDYFDKLETLFYDGSMEECGDVSLYQWDGVDKHGLNYWLRQRGSTRSELLHQKMKVAFGPHGVGVEVGHFLLLLVTYIFNVNTGVRRTRCHDFGMPWHHIIDRIQIRSIQIFGVDIFPRHENQSLWRDGRTKDSRRCSAAPFGCPNLAKDCSRRGWKKCRLVMARSTRVQVPETEEYQAIKVKEFKREQKTQFMRQLRRTSSNADNGCAGD